MYKKGLRCLVRFSILAIMMEGHKWKCQLLVLRLPLVCYYHLRYDHGTIYIWKKQINRYYMEICFNKFIWWSYWSEDAINDQDQVVSIYNDLLILFHVEYTQILICEFEYSQLSSILRVLTQDHMFMKQMNLNRLGSGLSGEWFLFGTIFLKKTFSNYL